jgi:hypothetical protein
MFGFLKRKKRLPSAPVPPAEAPGWDAIDRAFAAIYPDQRPRHWTHQGVHRMHDLRDPPENPLDGVNVYDAGTFWHFVSLGLTELYGKETQGDVSGFGYELTFRVGKRPGEDEPPLWPVNVMINLARAQWVGSDFAPGQSIQSGPLDGSKETRLTAMLTARDPAFELQRGPFGEFGFLLLVGVEASIHQRARAEGVQAVLAELDPALVTTLS